MNNLTHFFLGLTNEWLESMNSIIAGGGGGGATTDNASGVPKDSFPIQVKGICEMYSLSKLFKTLSLAMPNTKVKILKMSKQATTKQFLESLTRS
jgi:hypothetical protein